MSINELYFSASLHRICLNYQHGVEGVLKLNSEEFYLKLVYFHMGVVTQAMWNLCPWEYCDQIYKCCSGASSALPLLAVEEIDIILQEIENTSVGMKSGRRHCIEFSYLIHWWRNSLCRYVITMENFAGLYLFKKLDFLHFLKL